MRDETSFPVDEMWGIARRLALVTRRSWPARLGEAPIDDLIAEGLMAAVECWDRYDSTTGVPFVPFALQRMRGAMWDLARRLSWQTRRHREAGLPSRGLVSLEELLRPTQPGTLSVADLVADPERGPEESAVVAEEIAALREGIDGLSEREIELLERKYFDDEAMAPLAAEWGISESRVSQIHTRALSRLRERLAS